MNVVEITNLTKSYGETSVIKNVNLSIEQGEFISLLGPSGCGKTTMLRILAGLTDATGGQVVVNGADMAGVPPYKRSNGMVFQNYALFPHLTVAQNIEYGLKMRKVGKKERAEKVEYGLQLVQMQQLGKRYPNELSGGQQQRVALARALVLNPTLLLLDEPLSNLDAKLRKEMQIEIRSIQQSLNVTTIFVTHDQEEALIMSDRIAVMHQGVIEQIGTPRELYKRPKTEFVASFIGVTNLLKGTVTRVSNETVEISCGGTSFTVTKEGNPSVHEEITFFVRPEAIRIERTPEAFHENILEAQILSKIYLGSQMRFICKTANGDEIRVTTPCTTDATDAVELNADEKVYLSWDVRAARNIYR